MRFLIVLCFLGALTVDYSSQLRPDPPPEINVTSIASQDSLGPSDDQLSDDQEKFEMAEAKNSSNGRRVIHRGAVTRAARIYCVRGIRVGGLCLSFSNDNVTLNEAKESCKSNYGVLAAISGTKDLEDVRSYIKRNYDDPDEVKFWYFTIDNKGTPDEDEKRRYICNLDVSNECKTKDSCALLGGTCVAGTGCNGRLVSGGCKKTKGRKCKCCIPECPTTAGFFISPGRQCMKFFGDKERSWLEARTKCQQEGLSMSEPFDPVGLNSYILARQGSKANCVLGARGTGSDFQWLSDGQILSNSNPWWNPSIPGGRFGPNWCLAITMVDPNLATPYWRTDCYITWTKYPRYALCEMVLN